MKKIIETLIVYLKGRKLQSKQFKKSLYGSRMFYDVEFKNVSNIEISVSSNIEKGSLIYVVDPKNNTDQNIIIEDNCWIGRNVEVQSVYGTKIKIKEFVSIQDRCKLLGSVTIGKYSILAPDIFMSSGNHFFKHKPYLTIREQDQECCNSFEKFQLIDEPIYIEEDCWIGKNVFVKQGVYIGRGAIIGTNSIVTTDVEPYSISAGTPANKKSERLLFMPPKEISAFNILDLPYFYRGFEHYNNAFRIEDLIKNNCGISSENNSFVVLENSSWKNIVISGFSKQAANLNIYVNGLLYLNHQKVSSDFEIILDHSVIKNDVLYKDYELLPDMIKKYLCIHFEYTTHNVQKYNYQISKVITLC